VHPNEAYYLIEKESSKVSPEEFRAFCDQMKIPYEIEMPSKHFVNKDSISESFKVPEPVFDLEILAGLLKDEASELGIRLRTGFEVVCFNIQGNQYIITARRNREQTNYDADILLNATYAYTNNILRIIGLEEDMTEYALQRTEVAIARSKIEIPALTIMDGEFISVLPYGREQNLVLVYDVIHSVVDKENGFFLDDTKKYPTNWNKMIAHGEKYLPFIRNLDYVDSLWGARPIPSRITGDSRKTRIRSHKKCPGIYSILEGKFISAPLVADRLIEQMRIDGFVK
jgi:glycerol-3-phosphate dehydrogenase